MLQDTNGYNKHEHHCDECGDFLRQKVASVDLEEKVRDNPKFKFMRAIKLNNL
jgi:hypothetical protein